MVISGFRFLGAVKSLQGLGDGFILHSAHSFLYKDNIPRSIRFVKKKRKSACKLHMIVLLLGRYEKAVIGLPCVGFAHTARAGWWKPLACSVGLSPGSRRLNARASRAGRVMPLSILDMIVSESAPFSAAKMRVVPRKHCLSSRFGIEGFFHF